MQRWLIITGSSALLMLVVVLGVRNMDQPGSSNKSMAMDSVEPGAISAPVFSSDITPTIVADVQQRLAQTSLAGLDVPAGLRQDAAGDLIPDAHTRALLDFFLSLSGERDDASIRVLFAAAAAAQCSPRCIAQAMAVYDQYRDYLAALQQLSHDLQATDNLRSRLEQVSALRQQMLGSELADALFGPDVTYDDLRVAQWEIHQNPTLTETERQQALQSLQDGLPADLAAREQENRSWEAARSLNHSLAEQNADESTRFAVRSEQLGIAAAERLRELDVRRADWDRRYQDYRAERLHIEQAHLEAEDRRQQIDQLRLRHFDAVEGQRAAALDRIHADKS